VEPGTGGGGLNRLRGRLRRTWSRVWSGARFNRTRRSGARFNRTRRNGTRFGGNWIWRGYRRNGAREGVSYQILFTRNVDNGTSKLRQVSKLTLLTS